MKGIKGYQEAHWTSHSDVNGNPHKPYVLSLLLFSPQLGRSLILTVLAFVCYSAVEKYRKEILLCTPGGQEAIHVGTPSVSLVCHVVKCWSILYTSIRKVTFTVEDITLNSLNQDAPPVMR